MKIKEDKEFKMPQIMFKTIWANFMFMVLLAAMFVNGLLEVVDYGSADLIPFGLTIFGVVAFYLMMVGGPGEAFARNAPDVNFQDLRRTVIYVVITFIVFVGIFQYKKHNEIIPIPPKLVAEKSIKITELSIFDIHNSKIKYAIGYKDINGSVKWQSNFEALKDRTEYLKTLVDNNKFKVEIYFKVSKHNKGSLEIIKQTIKG